MCTSWVSFKQLCEQTDATLKKQLNMIKTSKTSYEPLDSFELVKINSDQLISIPENIAGWFVYNKNGQYEKLIFFFLTVNDEGNGIKNESSIDETNEQENNFEDDPDITSDSEDDDEELSNSEYKSKKYQKKKILQPKKSYYKPKNKFTCTTCTKTFRNAERLEAHVRQHLGQKV